ncbi:MAG: DUF4340 domain-containing protein [Bacteroidia bacterium]
MNKTQKILFALVILTGLIYWFWSRQPWNTMKGERSDFSIKDTGAITKMFFADKKGNKVLVEQKEKNKWIVNGKYAADQDKIFILLSTMHDVQVRNPISDSEHNTVVADLATAGIKAEFYAGEKNVKTIYVGSATPDQTGTFMLVEGSSKPFVTHISGFAGYLTSRFITIEKYWRSKEVFNLKGSDIKEISVSYPEHPERSFLLENKTQPVLSSNGRLINADLKFLNFYLESFHGLFFEVYANATPAMMDSISKRIPFCIFRITKPDGKTTTLRLFNKPLRSEIVAELDQDPNIPMYDKARYFGFINDEKEMFVVQNYAFGKIIKTLEDFTGIEVSKE